MSADLDATLQPGETIVYRTGGRSYTVAVVYYCIILQSLALFFWLNAIVRRPDPVDFLAGGITFVVIGIGLAAPLFGLLISKFWQRWTPDELVVTDLRVLFANGDWDDRLEALALDRIDRISWIADGGFRHLAVVGKDTTIRMDHLRDADAAAQAIADAAGLEAPPALGRLTRAEPAQIGLLPGIFATYLCLIVLFRSVGWTAAGGPLDFEVWWSEIAFQLFVWVVAVPVGALIGGALTLALLRPFVPADRTLSAICAGRRDSWNIRLALRWAGLLYGRPMPYRPC